MLDQHDDEAEVIAQCLCQEYLLVTYLFKYYGIILMENMPAFIPSMIKFHEVECSMGLKFELSICFIFYIFMSPGNSHLYIEVTDKKNLIESAGICINMLTSYKSLLAKKEHLVEIHQGIKDCWSEGSQPAKRWPVTWSSFRNFIKKVTSTSEVKTTIIWRCCESDGDGMVSEKQVARLWATSIWCLESLPQK